MFRLIAPVLFAALAAGCPNTETTLGDVTEPSITLVSPQQAEWLDLGVTDTNGEWQALTDISVNEQPMNVSGTLTGQFGGQLELGRGITIVEASGVDNRGDSTFVKSHVLAGEFTGPRVAVEDAAIVRLNEEGISVILNTVEDAVDPVLLTSILVTPDPIYEGEFLDFDNDSEGLIGIDLYVDGVDLSYVELDVVLMEDEMAFTASIYGLDIDTSVVAFFSGSQLFDTGVAVFAERVDITGTLTMSAFQGELDVQLLDSDVQVTDLAIDLSAIPGNFEEQILGPVLEGVVETQVSGLLGEQITTLMRETLSAFDLSFETELLGKPVVVDAEFSGASIDPAGVELRMDVDVDMPNTTVHPYTGVLTAPGVRPTPDANADVSLSLWDDMLNKMLFEAWRADMLVQNLSSEDGSLTPIALLALQADRATIAVDGLLPPVVVQDEGGNLEAQLGEVYIIIDMEGSDLGTHLELALAVNVDVDIDVVDGVIDVGLGTPELDIMVRDSDWGASNEAVSALLVDVLPIDLILSLIGDLTFPLPELPGLTVDANAGRDGNGTHTAVRLSLRQTEQ
jgi:hypothetical protein